jgi:hypothetical protein
MLPGLLSAAAVTAIFFLRELCDSSVLSVVKEKVKYSRTSRRR